MTTTTMTGPAAAMETNRRRNRAVSASLQEQCSSSPGWDWTRGSREPVLEPALALGPESALPPRQREPRAVHLHLPAAAAAAVAAALEDNNNTLITHSSFLGVLVVHAR